MSTITTRYTKFQVGAAAAALTAATVLTPAAIAPTIAYAAPSANTISQEVGAGFVGLAAVGDPIVTPAAASPCATADFSVGCYAVEGFNSAAQSFVRGAVVFVGTAAYVVAAGTGQLFKLVGSVIPGPIGSFFTSVGDGVSAFANQIAITFQVGPYQTAQ